MSILAAAAAEEAITSAHLAWAAGLLAFGVLVAYFLGAFRAANINGPVRLAPDTSAGGILVLFILAFITWLGLQVAYGSVRAVQHARSGSLEPFSAAVLNATDYAFLSTVPFIAALLVLIVGGRMTQPTLPRELGWTLDKLPGGLWRGAVWSLSIVPIVMGAGVFVEMFYRAIGYDHPTAHELLKVMSESRDPLVRAALIVGATLLAPVYEEFLFRGHLQTILTRLFSPRRAHAQPAPPPLVPSMEMAGAGGDVAVTTPIAIEKVASQPPSALTPAMRWTAILLASAVFAMLHPAWTRPLIFLLSVGMGYAYERTGNLWVPVVIHLLFNTFNTVVTLLLNRFEPAASPL